MVPILIFWGMLALTETTLAITGTLLPHPRRIESMIDRDYDPVASASIPRLGDLGAPGG
jgi:hypothetical protein